MFFVVFAGRDVKMVGRRFWRRFSIDVFFSISCFPFDFLGDVCVIASLKFLSAQAFFQFPIP